MYIYFIVKYQANWNATKLNTPAMALYGIPRGRPWSDPGSDRGDDDISWPDDVISTAVLSFSHL